MRISQLEQTSNTCDTTTVRLDVCNERAMQGHTVLQCFEHHTSEASFLIDPSAVMLQLMKGMTVVFEQH